MTTAKTIGMVEVVFRRPGRDTTERHDDVDVESDELGGKLREPLHCGVRPFYQRARLATAFRRLRRSSR